jgi:hypothetical protein
LSTLAGQQSDRAVKPPGAACYQERAGADADAAVVLMQRWRCQTAGGTWPCELQPTAILPPVPARDQRNRDHLARHHQQALAQPSYKVT